MRKERKRIMFRVDSSTTIGSGHVMRCLTLAAELRKIGAETEFICRELPGNLSGLIRQHGHFVHLLPRSERTNRSSDWCSHATWLEVPWKQDANECLLVMKQGSSCEWLVVDHYALNQNWEQTLRPHVEKIMIIDDLADRVHDCDLLLDQNLYSEEGRYDGLLPIECLTLLGPKFALLRPEFKEMRAQLKKRTGKINRILVFFGGVDASNETARVIKIIRSLPQKNVFLDVVVGAANQHRMEIEQLCLEMPLVNYHCQVCNMAELLAAADLAIGAGGGHVGNGAH
ncbi:MAG: UDP-2,4-diacetamido-2,4,6-trideoxy-beta-L-altropyranose hydrolase [Proteobacteria bacterium]|nr:UDP-2,4-diacetamido-2,4,6-trideoxy-beta-L-altropyranose hydrolase [Pseudomonadota bacterium]